ncbi:hypothetical protein SAMN05216303_109122 [Rhodoferax sp. OV413]|uniref:hypothetical protein n=1 Tax=Rhodoferax sp. OV413 TaxID=1855285 RepID=UPI000891D2CE|nr:hypothetical protein [Rhodoferax sp. OV413]SDP90878.1 hypothetical protein SAMN05216303_109122 [Rhodoferax sp. OV413]
MSLLNHKSVRRMVPRWRASTSAMSSMEFASLKAAVQPSGNISAQVAEVTKDFMETPSMGNAAEVLSTLAVSEFREAGADAANYVLSHSAHAPQLLLELARNTRRNSLTNFRQKSVKETRQLLRLHPDNPMLWSDIARHLATIGKKAEARRAMMTAFHLAPNHRWMLRTTARVMAHLDDGVSAHKLLANHPRTRFDPWLMAAELACAQVAGRAPKFWKQANDMLKWGGVAPAHLSELATAVGMMELEGGKRKNARKLVHMGLIAPTENVLAQVFWAKENKHLNDGFGLDALVSSSVDAFEAECQLSIGKGNLQDAVKFAQGWNEDEPFASRPKYELSYIACLLDDYELTEKTADDIARLNGARDPTLEMNSIFARLSSGKLSKEEDSEALAKIHDQLQLAISSGGLDQYHAIANLGLWHYRYGEALQGRELYQLAIAAAQKSHQHNSAALAATFAAREAILKMEPSANEDLVRAIKLSTASASNAGKFYVQKLERLIAEPGEAKRILSPDFRPLRPEATAQKTMRIERTDGKYVIMLTSSKL